MADSRLIFDLSLAELEEQLAAHGQPAYRARQVWTWLYQKRAASFDAMSNIPKALRAWLDSTFAFSHLSPLAEQLSSDGHTRKVLFQLPGDAQIESVLMAYDRRRTLCISTQAGCGMGCSFCATGQAGLQRSLAAGEIVEQVLFFARTAPAEFPLTNVVCMGMGEPFANYDNVLAALRRLNDPAGFGLGARRMTISTIGVLPGIHRLAGEDVQLNLAVSLHAATDSLRDQLVPLNKRYPLARLIEAVRDYVERTHRRVSFEWAMIENVNDGPDQARALARLAKGLVCHVNLIPLNPTPAYAGAASSRARLETFQAILEQAGLPHSLRLRRGIDIQAGCGQLRQRLGVGTLAP